MFALAAAIIFLLTGFGVLENGDDIVSWIAIGLAVLSVHFFFPIGLPFGRRD